MKAYPTWLLAGLSMVAWSQGCVRPPTVTSPPRSVSLPGPETRLPVRWLGDFPLVETYVDGDGPYAFVLDTGAAVSAISKDLSAASSGPSLPGGEITDSHGRTARTLGSRSVDLRIGQVRFQEVHAAIVDLEALSIVLGERLGGILGFPLFSECLLTLDYPRRQVWLRDGALGPVDGREVVMMATDPLPRIQVSAGPRYRELFLVDSGSVETIALEEWPKGAVFRSGPVPLAVGVSLLGSVRIDQVGRLAGDLALGRHLVTEPIVQSCVGGNRIGTGLLREFRVTFDARNQRIEFLRDRTTPIRMDPIMGTGMVFEIRPGAWIVLALVKGSPAERAGVQIGDQVVQVDDMPVDKLVGVTDWSWSNQFRFTIDRRGVVNQFRVGVAPLVP